MIALGKNEGFPNGSEQTDLHLWRPVALTREDSQARESLRRLEGTLRVGVHGMSGFKISTDSVRRRDWPLRDHVNPDSLAPSM